MPSLFVSAREQNALASLQAYAEANPIGLAMLVRVIHHQQPRIAWANHCVTIPSGHHVTFTVERLPAGWYRHASFRVEGGRRGGVVNIGAQTLLMRALGFEQERPEQSYVETQFAGSHPAVHVLERITTPSLLTKLQFSEELEKVPRDSERAAGP